MTAINTTIRRWCEKCQEFTKSELNDDGYEICAKCKDAP